MYPVRPVQWLREWKERYGTWVLIQCLTTFAARSMVRWKALDTDPLPTLFDIS
jgi:hypothetical protein